MEANPLAAKILARFGWWGLGFFKAASVAIVLFLGSVIWRKSRPAARRLMQLASCILVLVVTYSSCHMAHVEAANCLMTKERDRGSDIVQKRKNAKLYFGKLDQLTTELVAGKVTLPGAAKELTRYLDQVRHNPLRYLQTVAHGFNLEASLAVHLVHHAGLSLLEAPESARILLPRLRSEFASTFNAPLPEFALMYFPKEGEISEPPVVLNE